MILNDINEGKVFLDSEKSSKEKIYTSCNGCLILPINIILTLVSIAGIIASPIVHFAILEILFVPLLICTFFIWPGFFILNPNESMVLILFGEYKGSIKQQGYHWVNPFLSFKKISLRSNNLNGNIIKVNDKSGNPIQIGCVIVWRVNDTAKASFDVENYENYVTVQSESALRHIACMFPYDKIKEDDICLRSGHEMITKVLRDELNDRLFKAGIEVQEARISELAYSAEIANAMLKRQAAEAIISAREKIVQGAVSIVGHAIRSLAENDIVKLSDNDKSKLVSNMLVVLCSETQVHPVVSAGTA